MCSGHEDATLEGQNQPSLVWLSAGLKNVPFPASKEVGLVGGAAGAPGLGAASGLPPSRRWTRRAVTSRKAAFPKVSL